MANTYNKYQLKRTSVSGRTPNTTNSSNSSFLDTAELALNLTDKKMFSSNGTALFEIGANLSSINVTGNTIFGNTTINGFANITGTLAAGNTTITGLANVTTLNSGNVTVTGVANVTGNVSITDTMFGNNVVLTGNLTVSGTTTYINTVTLNVGDNIVTLNADWPNITTPTENAGIEVNRGSSANVQFVWDETNDRWTTNSQPMFIGGTLAAGNTTVTGFINVSSYGTFGGTVNATAINVGANVNLTTTSITIGNSTVNTSANSTLISSQTIGGPNTGIMLNGMNMFAFSNSGGNEGNPTFRSSVANNQTVLRVLPNGVVNVATQAQFEFFGVDYFSNTTNWHNFRILAQTDRFVIDTARGANSDPARPIVFDIGGTGQSNATNANYPAVLVLSANGKVGISNATPDATLTVTGTANISGNVAIGGTLTVPNTFGISNTSLSLNTGIQTWHYNGNQLSIAAKETAPTGLFFSTDGTKVYIVGTTSDAVHQYNLSTPYNVSTGVFASTFSIFAQDTTSGGIFFKPDGTKMYMAGQTGDAAYQYTLATPWDISTASYDSVSLSILTQDTSVGDIFFSPDGVYFYMLGYAGDTVSQYTLSTPWVISSATYTRNFSVVAIESTGTGISFTSNGLTMFVTGQGLNFINRYTLSVAWDVSTAVYVDRVSINNYEAAVTSLYYDGTVNKAWVIGSNSDNIYEFNTNDNSALKITSNTLLVTGVLQVGNNFAVDGATHLNGNVKVENNFTVDGSTSLGTTTVAGTLSATSTVTLGGSTTSTTSLGTAATTGTTTIGGTTQTGAITVGQSTGNQAINIATGATLAANLKTVNIGTGGLSGSFTNVNIGSSVSGANNQLTVYANTAAFNGNVTISSTANVATALYVGANVSVNTTTIFIGNTTTNTTISTSLISIGNSTVNTQISAGNVFLNGSLLTVGNTTVNTSINNGTANVSTLLNVGANVNLSTTQLNVGNTTVNAALTSSSLAITNAVSVTTNGHEFILPAATGQFKISRDNIGNSQGLNFQSTGGGNFLSFNSATTNAKSAVLDVPTSNTTADIFLDLRVAGVSKVKANSTIVTIAGAANVTGAFAVNNTAALGNTTITGRLGVANSTPSHTFQVDGTSWFKPNNDGTLADVMYLGRFSDSDQPAYIVKTNDATDDLLMIKSNRYNGYFNWKRNSANGEVYVSELMGVSGSQTYFRLYHTETDNTIKVQLATGGDSYINTAANVGIGTATPNAKLQVVGTVNISSTAIIGGALTVSNTAALGNTTITGFANASSLNVVGAATVNGAFTVNNTASVGNTTITGFANVSSTLNVVGAATVNGALTVNNTAAFGNTSITGTLGTGNTTITGNLTVTGNTTANNIRAQGSVQIDGNLTVSGNTITIGVTNLAVSDNIIYLNEPETATITSATSNATSFIYTALNGFSVGQVVTVAGITPSGYNVTSNSVTFANATTFAVANTVAGPGAYVSGGTATARVDTNPDIGFAANYNDGTYRHAGFFRDATDGVFKVFDQYLPEPSGAFIDTANASFRIADFQSNNTVMGSANVAGTTRLGVSNANYLQVVGAASAGVPTISAQGTDASIDIGYATKSGANHYFRTNGTVNQFVIAHTASAVNYLQVTGAPTGSTPYFLCSGSDTDIGVTHATKGAGAFAVWTNGGTTQQFRVAHTASAVNYVQVTGNATGSRPTISAQGSDTNINLAYSSKGTGGHDFYTAGTSFDRQLTVAHTASAVNYLQVTGAATGDRPVISPQGSDTNIGLNIETKGTGSMFFRTGGSSSAQFVITNTASSVNYIQATGSATGNAPVLSAQGTDTNLAFNIQSKGSGDLNLIGGASGWVSINPGSVRQFAARYIASAVNYLTVWGSTSGSSATTLSAAYASDTNVDVNIASKAAGVINLQTSGLAAGGTTQVRVVDTASAVNYIQLSGAITSSAPYVLATGTDTNVPLVLSSKGTASILFKTAGTTPTQFAVAHTASAVNYVQATGGSTGVGVTVSAQGTDSNVSMTVATKGTGSTTIYTPTSVGGTATNAQDIVNMQGLAGGNNLLLRVSLNRHTTGSDWTGVGYRFGHVVDVTPMSYIEFNPVGQSQGLAVNVAASAPFQVKTTGGEQFRVINTASAVNYVQVTGAATGSGPIVSAQGSDTDVRLNLTSKGTNSIDMLTNSAGTRQFRFSHTASAVNYLQATGSVTGSAPTLSVQGSDTDIGVVVNSKGAGSVNTQVNSVTKLSVGNTSVSLTGNTYLFLGSFNGEGGEIVFANTTGSTGPIIDVDGGNDWRWNTYNNASNIKFNTGASATTKLQISANGNVGISNTTPTETLSVTGTVQVTNATASVFLAAANGNIGIGYSTPNYKLRVGGTIVGDANDNFFGTISGDYVDIGNLGATGSVYFDARGASSNVNVQIRAKGSADHIFTVAGGATEIVRFKPSGNVGIGNSAPTDKLRVEGTLSHLGLVPSTGTGIDQIYTATPSITLNTTWQSTGVTSTNLANGSYMVQLYANDIAAGGTANNEYYTGMMSWYSADTNSTVLDEIPLHRAGVSGSNNAIFLATQRTATANTSDLLLMISSAANNSGASTYTIKFRRMI